jgi:hypothetical protein
MHTLSATIGTSLTNKLRGNVLLMKGRNGGAWGEARKETWAVSLLNGRDDSEHLIECADGAAVRFRCPDTARSRGVTVVEGGIRPW